MTQRTQRSDSSATTAAEFSPKLQEFLNGIPRLMGHYGRSKTGRRNPKKTTAEQIKRWAHGVQRSEPEK